MDKDKKLKTENKDQSQEKAKTIKVEFTISLLDSHETFFISVLILLK